MQASVMTATLVGVQAVPVEVQADVSSGLPMFGIVGLPDMAVQEARDRVRAAIATAGFRFPNARVIVNLAPAPLRKHGTGFDLPIALAVLCATGQLPADPFRTMCAVGELGLDASVRQVPGMLAHALAATSSGHELMGPAESSGVVGEVPGLVYRSLERMSVLRSGIPERSARVVVPPTAEPPTYVDLCDIAGHDTAKRCLEVAAAGGHNVLLVGPPGSGKTMLARSFCGLLPPLREAERLESALVHSVAGLDPSAALSGRRPFRAPHHSCSVAGLVGGGTPPRPGEISLAHTGVLFLDELPEFGPGALQALRQPIEEGVVTLVRAAGSIRYPSRVTLLGAMNPCQCGFAGDSERACSCSAATTARYQGRVGGPLYDRMDISLRIDRVDPALLLTERPESGTSREARERVCAAREFAAARGSASLRSTLSGRARATLEAAARGAHLSGRGVTRLLRVARTLADMEARARIEEDDIVEALSYRAWEAA